MTVAGHTLGRASLALAVVLGVVQPASRALAEVTGRDLAMLEAVADMSELSETLWPGWDIHDIPFALHDTTGSCYLMHHPRPPIAFARVRGRTPYKAAVYRATTATAGVAFDARIVNGVATAFLDIGEFQRDPAAAAVSEAFSAHMANECPGALEPVDLLTVYPVEPRQLAMADIECVLFSRARTAPPDSFPLILQELASVREMRRVSVGLRFVPYERWLEMKEGLPLYMGERARALVLGGAVGDARFRLAGRLPDALPAFCAPTDASDLEWYRWRRFALSGANVCFLLDRLGVKWQSEVRDRCVDPYTILLEHVPQPFPKAADVFARYGLDERTARREAFVEGAKTEGEKLFESITQGPGPLLSIGANLLSSVSVSYDRENIVRVDEHREVHTRLIKVEYSGGTHVYLSGRPIAAILGEGEMAYIQFMIRTPEDMRVVADGAPLELEEGIHQVQNGLLVEAQGLSIQASSALILVGEDRLTFMLQR